MTCHDAPMPSKTLKRLLQSLSICLLGGVLALPLAQAAETGNIVKKSKSTAVSKRKAVRAQPVAKRNSVVRVAAPQRVSRRPRAESTRASDLRTPVLDKKNRDRGASRDQSIVACLAYTCRACRTQPGKDL